jgi:hypothetical protein
MNTPIVRLAIRSLLAGAAILVSQLQSSDDPTSKAVWVSAAVAAGWAALEAFTPLNSLVGYFKKVS